MTDTPTDQRLSADKLEPLNSPRVGAARTVLFIEDNLANVGLMLDILVRRPDIALTVAMTGNIGLDLAREHRPCLILFDLNLPDMSGQEVLRRLQADQRTRSIPVVVVVSADATPGQAEQFLAQGAADYITKPFAVDRILTVVDKTDARREATLPAETLSASAQRWLVADPVASARNLHAAVMPGSSHATVLYVEDDRSNRRLMATLFAREFPHLDLVVASRGSEGVAMAVALQPSLILLDGQLPDMTGSDVVVALHAEAHTSEIPIVMVSGLPPKARGPNTSVAAHLVKPIDVAELCRVVNELVLDAIEGS